MTYHLHKSRPAPVQINELYEPFSCTAAQRSLGAQPLMPSRQNQAVEVLVYNVHCTCLSRHLAVMGMYLYL